MRYLLAIFLAASFAACDVKVKSSSEDANKASSESADKAADKTTSGSDGTENAKVRNDIDLKAEKLKIDQAFLMFEDGKLVPEGNKVDVGQKVQMRLILSGWQQEDGKAFVGATEEITTNSGETVLSTEDLFAGYTDGISVEDANIITLSAVITRMDRLYDYFKVSFRVWDKKGDGEVSGSYKLYIK